MKDLEIALLNLNSAEEAENFLRDLCTPAELKAMRERWRVAQLLESGNLSYADIHSETGVSITTIGRVARFLKDEPYGGYRLLLKKIKNSDQH